eukprot:m.990013 g.990013  ORF g.990013 m.990013 type:complete len:371 (-) comp24000_c1_seq5:1997-3109(-)
MFHCVLPFQTGLSEPTQRILFLSKDQRLPPELNPLFAAGFSHMCPLFGLSTVPAAAQRCPVRTVLHLPHTETHAKYPRPSTHMHTRTPTIHTRTYTRTSNITYWFRYTCNWCSKRWHIVTTMIDIGGCLEHSARTTTTRSAPAQSTLVVNGTFLTNELCHHESRRVIAVEQVWRRRSQRGEVIARFVKHFVILILFAVFILRTSHRWGLSWMKSAVIQRRYKRRDSRHSMNNRGGEESFLWIATLSTRQLTETMCNGILDRLFDSAHVLHTSLMQSVGGAAGLAVPCDASQETSCVADWLCRKACAASNSRFSRMFSCSILSSSRVAASSASVGLRGACTMILFPTCVRPCLMARAFCPADARPRGVWAM